ncbi:uncharacterized protein LOC119667545 [Teleopsis dalmanni]|uniref:uncharacterized protein LOC119667545 n=1 Tax=Teleopsis dalmanni TaxID=139649 RepID=UPI0018CDAEF9|nr:uncharacterized protein LOC119667545 [Teleopsis dalmanni]
MTVLENMIENTNPTGNLSLVLSTVWIIVNSYAKSTTSSISFGQFASNDKSYFYHNDLIEEILKRANQHENGMSIKFFIGDGNVYEINDDGNETESNHLLTEEELFMYNFRNKDKGIWLIDSLKAFNQLEDTLQRTHNYFQRNGLFTIIYTGSELERYRNIRKMFRRLFYIYVTNINILILTKKTVEVYTYFPFNSKVCHSSVPELYVTFEGILERENFRLPKKYFPDKLLNMHGCQLVVTTWHDPPFVFIDYFNKSGNILRIHGIEGNLLTFIAEKLNFTIRILEPPERDHGVVTENGTVTGAMKMIVDGTSNITMASFLYNKMRADAMQAAYSYISCSLMLTIPKGHQLSPFKRLTKPFSYIIWIGLKTNRIPFTNLWSTLYGISIHNRLPKKNFARYTLAIWLIYTLVLRNAYLSELYSILQDGRTLTSLDTIQEVVEQNYTFYTTQPLVTMLKASIKSVKLKLADSFDDLSRNVHNHLFLKDESLVVPLMAPYILAYNQNKSNHAHPLNVLHEKLTMVPITLYMRKHSYLLYKFNEIITFLMSSGFIRKFEDVYLDTKYLVKKEFHMPIALSFWLLFGLFTIYIFLLLLCTFVFFLELWSTRSPIVKAVLDLFNS